MNLNFKPEDTALLPLVNPVGEPLVNNDGEQVEIEIYSTESDHFRKVQNRALNDRLKDKRKMTAEKQEIATSKALADCVKSLGDLEGAEFPGGIECNAKNLPRILRENNWLKVQIDDGMGDNSLFMVSASKTPKKS